MKLESINIFQNKVNLIKLLLNINRCIHQRHSGQVVIHRTQPKYNICTVNEIIAKRLPIPVRDFAFDPGLIRSFDVNKPGAEVHELEGGVASVFILTGQGNKSRFVQLSQRKTLRAGTVQARFQQDLSGKLIGIRTKIDPTLCRVDRFVGQVLGVVGKLPKRIWSLKQFVPSLDVHTEKKQTQVSKFAKNELMVIGMRGALAKVQLTSPACTEVGGKVVLLRHIEKHWWLVLKANLHMYHFWSMQMQVFFISVVNMFIKKSGFPDQLRLVGNNKNIESIVDEMGEIFAKNKQTDGIHY
ncbi:uncharacterized protein HD556DRAFT_1484540 [Suillus plorans]|uniref:Initiation factor eIF2 gamma C-terminal domain-containing protein n=1 Tax=Suillus plorans TaxID=116603 RepID=A0A9P7J5K4_9AGAM|nr:uncharacterized protein HD556DRAFT_1484540 [Suillus plorans]KAG1803918.1 hypothetical protein HD556DRAFT_1484540 [Suillus plorans]